MMGTANALVSEALHERLCARDDIKITRAGKWGEGLVSIAFSSDKLPDGYHGQQDIILNGDELRFKKDCDV